MKIKTKIVGLSLAVVTLTSCLSSVTISAADNNIVKDGISNLESQMMTIEEVEFFRRIKNEYESKKDQLRSYSFAQYNTYVTNQQSSTTHYLAVVGDQYDWFGNCNIHYYLNTNLGSAYSNINNYWLFRHDGG